MGKSGEQRFLDPEESGCRRGAGGGGLSKGNRTEASARDFAAGLSDWAALVSRARSERNWGVRPWMIGPELLKPDR